jgi:hypothetical protein
MAALKNLPHELWTELLVGRELDGLGSANSKLATARLQHRLRVVILSTNVVRFSEGDFMAKLIDFYIPSGFRKSAKWVPAKKRGKVIEFAPRKTA